MLPIDSNIIGFFKISLEHATIIAGNTVDFFGGMHIHDRPCATGKPLKKHRIYKVQTSLADIFFNSLGRGLEKLLNKIRF